MQDFLDAIFPRGKIIKLELLTQITYITTNYLEKKAVRRQAFSSQICVSFNLFFSLRPHDAIWKEEHLSI